MIPVLWGHGFKFCWSREFFFQLLTQLHKLHSQLQGGSSFIWFHFRSSLICFIPYTFVIKILVIIPAFIIRSSYNHKYLRDLVSDFVLNGWYVILCLWSPPLPLSKLLVIQGHAQNLGGKTLNGGKGGRGWGGVECYISQTCD